jgi:protein-S-isoprenylcysteine O-methyltransferase Ste14
VLDISPALRCSRNPRYVSLTRIYLGECAIFAHLWSLLMLVPTLVFVNGVVVPFEKAQLRAAFGDRYCDYCATVRRWL